MSRHGQYKTAVEYFHQPVKTTEIYSEYKGPDQFSNEAYKYTEPVSVNTPAPSPKKKENNDRSTMKWDTVNYANTSDPRVWGPSFWFTLHNGAAKYPVDASPYVIERMKVYILGIPIMLPCEQCKVHATNYIEKNKDKLNQICCGRTSLFQFFVDFHNIVNKRFNKPVLSYDQAWEIYNKGIEIKTMTYN